MNLPFPGRVHVSQAAPLHPGPFYCSPNWIRFMLISWRHSTPRPNGPFQYLAPVQSWPEAISIRYTYFLLLKMCGLLEGSQNAHKHFQLVYLPYAFHTTCNSCPPSPTLLYLSGSWPGVGMASYKGIIQVWTYSLTNLPKIFNLRFVCSKKKNFCSANK